MCIRAQLGRESLDKGDRTALAASHLPLISRAPAELGEQGAKEGAQHLAGEPRVVRANARTREQVLANLLLAREKESPHSGPRFECDVTWVG
jgi:hypothetical protein